MAKWDKHDSYYLEYSNLHWTACYEEDYSLHKLRKDEEYYPKTSTKYHQEKIELWKIWTADKVKQEHQIEELSLKPEDESLKEIKISKKMKEQKKFT